MSLTSLQSSARLMFDAHPSPHGCSLPLHRRMVGILPTLSFDGRGTILGIGNHLFQSMKV